MTKQPKILVTGATGFIGTNLIPILLEKGYAIVASSRNIEKARNQPWFKLVEYISWTIENTPASINLYNHFNQPDLLIHLAWEGLPNYGSSHHIESNMMANYYFCKNLIQHGLKDLTIAGTCMEYGKINGELNEEMASNPANAYAIGKLNLLNCLNALKNQFGFDLKWLRLFYMYGEGQNKNSLYPQLMDAIRDRKEYFNMSKGDQIRDYLSIQEMATYIIKVALQTNITGIINICSGRPITVKLFVENIIKQHNSSLQLNTGVFPYSEHEAMYFWGNNSKLSKIITNE